MGLLKEVLKRKPIAESVNGIKLYRIRESIQPGTRVEVNGKIGTVKKELTRFSHDEPLYMVVHKDDKVTVAHEHEMIIKEARTLSRRDDDRLHAAMYRWQTAAKEYQYGFPGFARSRFEIRGVEEENRRPVMYAIVEADSYGKRDRQSAVNWFKHVLKTQANLEAEKAEEYEIEDDPEDRTPKIGVRVVGRI